ncbi:MULTISPECIES: glycosyltransferase family 2 protein [unclassified Coleofasciculus]|uniref:glycosyltransferase family 2 protein n=1 Tax=unclassified Coleofasciculus TaxID=2692782 RepID=UPI001880ED61|nr:MULTISPECIES: glycosyltransferase [unclassified Coleofasciculus]MBE9127582.1 glycosyltransferase [Coleofasciculus sp. LEGE 07081]MBE9149787.1 glycosyltransferase [Coleofasciculus sp. LEGE 07092]
MLYPIKVVDIELSRPITTIEGLDGYMGLQGLVRLHGVPVGYVKAPITNGCCMASTLSKLILEEHSWTIINRLLENGLAAPPTPEGLRLEDLFDVPPPEYEGTLPLVTVAVCTRDRTSDLALCLDALCQLDYPNLDILVVDNAPTSESTKELVQVKYPHVRYVCEPRPGLDWARNRAIIEAKGEIIAYTDDDVVVDPGWVKALAKVFAENPEVMAVTGLVVPYELETESQVLFEMYGGFGRGFERKWHRVYPGSKMPWQCLGTGQFGTGANMAYRRCVFDEIGSFDPALDVGTVTNGGGDLEMFFRVLKEGHTLVYEPNAVVKHRHRRDYAKLRSQIANNSIGLFSYCLRSLFVYPEERFSFLKLFVWWVVYWNLRRLWISFKHPTRFPKDLIQAELGGCFIGLTRYQTARRTAAEIANSFGSQSPESDRYHPVSKDTTTAPSRKVAVRTAELSQPLQPLTDVTDYSDVQVFVTWKGEPLGGITIPNIYQPISTNRLSEEIVKQLGLKLLKPACRRTVDVRWAESVSILSDRYTPTEKETALPEGLPTNVSVSINLATYDRPDDLRNCLRCLIAQETPRQVEIIVVDNNPSSGLTPPIVAEFPGVKLVSEPRQGLAYARNAGFVASTGDIVIATDDDVTLPSDWLEKLVVPFARPEVMIVTGNVLPLQLETVYQRFFERYGGLGRGFERFEANGDWFESFPRDAVSTWRLGATANAAFRASMFTHPQIGLMEESLGPGMPSGVGEDTYLFYKVLKAGYTLVYEPAAYVWHKHRRDIAALRRQIYGYSKGHVSYNLTTWLRDDDWRGLWRIFVTLPLVHLLRIIKCLGGRSEYPLSLIVLEIVGNLAGPWSLWQSYRRVKREGCSSPYIPPQERSVVATETLQVETLQPATVGNSQNVS